MKKGKGISKAVFNSLKIVVEKDQGRKMMPILICQQCGRMFDVTPSREHSARYCSKECQIVATQKK